MRTTAVELNPAVIGACRAWFQLPRDDARLSVIAGRCRARGSRDGACRQRRRAAASICTTTRPPAPVLDSAAFYADCRALLADGGVMTVNLFGRDASFERSAGAHRRGLRRRRACWSLPADARGQHRRAGARSDADAARSRGACRARAKRSKLAAACRPRKWLRRMVRQPRRLTALPWRSPSPMPHAHDAATDESDLARRPTPAATPAAAPRRLDWRELLEWLRDDRVISAEEAERTRAPLRRRRQRAASAGAARRRRPGARAPSGKPLDIEALTEWLAKRCDLPYLRIDPLKVDVGRVADVMSISYAERRHALPLSVGAHRGDGRHLRAARHRAGWPRSRRTRAAHGEARASPTRSRSRATRPSSTRSSRSVRDAHQEGESAALANFEQLVELGKSNKQLDANDQGVVQVVDWLWQYAFDQRAIRHPPRAAARARRDPLSHRRRAAHRLPAAAGRDERDDRAHQAARPHGRGREAPPAGRPHQDAQSRTATRSRCACRRCRPRSARRW